MEVELILKQIEKLILSAEFENAFELSRRLVDKYDNEAFKNELILIHSRYTQITKDAQLGILKYEEFLSHQNRIVQAFLNIIVNKIRKEYKNELNKINLEEKDSLGRTLKIVKETKEVFQLYGGGIIRQRAFYSSFSIPNRATNEPIWNLWQKEHFTELRLERYWLEEHVKKHYCKLILKPFSRREMNVANSQYLILRLKALLNFLETYKDKIDIVIIPEHNSFKKRNILLVGKYFYAESNKHSTQGWKNTSFKSEKIQKRINEFDDEFYQILSEMKLPAAS